MNRTLAAMAATTVLLTGLTGLTAPSAPAMAAPVSRAQAGAPLLTVTQLTRVFPDYAEGSRHTSGRPYYAPTSAQRCTRTRAIRAPRQSSAFYLEKDGNQNGPQVSQSVMVFDSVDEAKAVLGVFRTYLRQCEGRRTFHDGSPVPIRTSVQGWSLPKIGQERVGMLTLYAQGRFGNRTGFVVAREGAAVSILEVAPVDNLAYPSKKRSVRASTIGLRNLS